MLHPFRRLSLTTTHNLEIELSVLEVTVMGEITLVQCARSVPLKVATRHMTLFLTLNTKVQIGVIKGHKGK